jgi:hypothetical protein
VILIPATLNELNKVRARPDEETCNEIKHANICRGEKGDDTSMSSTCIDVDLIGQAATSIVLDLT